MPPTNGRHPDAWGYPVSGGGRSVTGHFASHWKSWLAVAAVLGGGSVMAFADRFIVTRDAYAQDTKAHAEAHKSEADALKSAVVEALTQAMAQAQQSQRQADAARDRKLDVISCLVSRGTWDPLTDACSRPVPGTP